MGNCGPVLIVGDDAGLRELVGSLLQREGFATSEAATTEEALKQAEEQAPSVVIVDADLGGGKSAYELYQELRDRISELDAALHPGGGRHHVLQLDNGVRHLEVFRHRRSRGDCDGARPLGVANPLYAQLDATGRHGAKRVPTLGVGQRGECRSNDTDSHLGERLTRLRRRDSPGDCGGLCAG